MPSPTSLAKLGPVHAPVWACVVCYQVQADAIAPLLNVLRPQFARILLLDNSPDFCPSLARLADADLSYLPMSANLGTAGALNEAWSLALAAQAGAMVSFDQDSVPAPGMVACLLATWNQLVNQGQPVAAMGPGMIDPRTGRSTRVLLPLTFRRRHRMPTGSLPIESDHLITSGTMISRDAYLAVGPFLEGLFLDYTDIEWSLRARRKGYKTFVQPATVMTHIIGDEIIEFAGRGLAVHAPQRTYLLLRNHLLLWRLGCTRLGWLLRDLVQIHLKIILLLLLRPVGLKRLKWVIKGGWHGLIGRDGPP